MSTQGAETKTQSGSIEDSLKCLSGAVGGVAERIGIEDAICGKIVRMKAGPNRRFRPGRETAAIHQLFLLSISYNTRGGVLQILKERIIRLKAADCPSEDMDAGSAITGEIPAGEEGSSHTVCTAQVHAAGRPSGI
jgi:hypothetical protein